MYSGILRSLWKIPHNIPLNMCGEQENSKIHCIKVWWWQKNLKMGKTPFLNYRAFLTDSCIPHFKWSRSKQTNMAIFDPIDYYRHFMILCTFPHPPPHKERGDEIYWESLLLGFRQIIFYLPEQVPANKFLFAGIVPANKFLFAGTVPANKILFAGTVPANNLFHLKNLIYKTKTI